MTQDEIRKLLGGYATNALTADERRMLFEAALEDQELFNALQNEDALRELLADPGVRDQVRSALATPAKVTHQAGFSWRRWVFGVAVPAVAAVIVIVVMNRARAPEQISQSVQMAQVEPKQVPSAPEAAPPEAEKQSTSARAARAGRPLRAPHTQEIPAPIQPDAGRQADASVATLQPPAPPAVSPKDAPSEVASKSEAEAPPADKKQATSIRVPQPQAAAVRLESAQRDNAPVAGFRSATAPPVIPEAARQQLSAGIAANAPLYQGPLVQYSVARGSHDGNAVRVDVTLAIAGYLALYHVDTAGNFRRVYPADGEATQALPNIAMQIPINPVRVDAGEKLRLVVVPAGPGGVVVGALGGVMNGAAQPTLVKPLQAPPSPLVVDIPIAPN